MQPGVSQGRLASPTPALALVARTRLVGPSGLGGHSATFTQSVSLGLPSRPGCVRRATRCVMNLRRCRIWSYLVLLTPYSAVARRGTSLNSPLRRGHKHLFSRSALNCCHLCVCYNTREGVHRTPSSEFTGYPSTPSMSGGFPAGRMSSTGGQH